MAIYQTKSQILENRTATFTVKIIELTKALPKNAENQIVINQLIKSASSIGANYTEANNAASRLDFRNKIFIAKKEAAETRYWLRIIAATNTNLDISGYLAECSELLFILQKVISALKNAK